MATRADYPDPFVKKHQEEFLEEVQNGNVEQVKNRLPSFDSLNFKIPSNGYTAFHIAVSNKCLQILEMLISHSKIDINARALKGETPLLLAVETENYDACLQLVQAGADVNLATYKNKNLIMITQVAPLHIAAEYQNTQILELLLCQDNIDVNVKKSNEETPLLSAVRENNFEAVQLLVQAGADPNATLRCPNVQSLNGATALHLAIENDNQQILHFLLSQSAVDIEIRKKDGRTPLFLAVAQSKYDAAEMLIQKGADITVCGYQNDRRDSLLHVAVKNDDLRVLDLLISMDQLDICNAQNLSGETPLYLAAKSGWYEGIRLLAQTGADVNMSTKLPENSSPKRIRNIDGFGLLDTVHCFPHMIVTETPLFASVKHPRCAHLLISLGADVDALNNFDKDTALHKAVEEGCLETVCMLLYYNADANIVNLSGNTPFMYSFKYEMSEEDQQIQDILLEYTTEFDTSRSVYEENSLELAFKINSPNVKKIFEKGCKVRAQSLMPCIYGVFPNKDNFKLMWDNLKYDKDNAQVSITMVLNMSGFETNDIKQFLDVIIESPNVDLLLKSTTTPSFFEFNNYNDVFTRRHSYRFSVFSFPNFIRTFYELKYDEDLLIKLMFRLLENSYELKVEDISVIFSCYGYCQLIKLLRYMDYYGNWKPTDIMLRLIFDVHATVDKIKRDFVEYVHREPLESMEKLRSQMESYFKYCSGTEVLPLADNFPEYIIAASVPKLTEIARNKTREFIVRAYNTSATCQYYTIVDHLNIPLICKKILKFEKRLY